MAVESPYIGSRRLLTGSSDNSSKRLSTREGKCPLRWVRKNLCKGGEDREIDEKLLGVDI
jgi:hypothetical protein